MTSVPGPIEGNWYNGLVLPSISLDIMDYTGRHLSVGGRVRNDRARAAAPRDRRGRQRDCAPFRGLLAAREEGWMAHSQARRSMDNDRLTDPSPSGGGGYDAALLDHWLAGRTRVDVRSRRG